MQTRSSVRPVKPAVAGVSAASVVPEGHASAVAPGIEPGTVQPVVKLLSAVSVGANAPTKLAATNVESTVVGSVGVTEFSLTPGKTPSSEFDGNSTLLAPVAKSAAPLPA
ncbi:MAG: hypothetical protein AAGJ87_17150, partial [Pseudomonadota bacterium]